MNAIKSGHPACCHIFSVTLKVTANQTFDIMKYLIIALAVTAISAEHFAEDGTSIIDEFLETGMQLPCIPKTCPPVCKSVTKYVEYGAYKLPYQENVCEPDTKCLADKAGTFLLLATSPEEAMIHLYRPQLASPSSRQP